MPRANPPPGIYFVEGRLLLCPTCGYEMDTNTTHHAPDETRGEPEAGDASICLRCGSLAVFNGVGGLMEPTPEDIAEFKKDEEGWRAICDAQLGIQQLRQSGNWIPNHQVKQ